MTQTSFAFFFDAWCWYVWGCGSVPSTCEGHLTWAVNQGRWVSSNYPEFESVTGVGKKRTSLLLTTIFFVVWALTDAVLEDFTLYFFCNSVHQPGDCTGIVKQWKIILTGTLLLRLVVDKKVQLVKPACVALIFVRPFATNFHSPRHDRAFSFFSLKSLLLFFFPKAECSYFSNFILCT